MLNTVKVVIETDTRQYEQRSCDTAQIESLGQLALKTVFDIFDCYFCSLRKKFLFIFFRNYQRHDAIDFCYTAAKVAIYLI